MSRIATCLIAGFCACAILSVPHLAHAQSGPSQAKTVTLHFTNGLKFDVPPGWRLADLSPTAVTLFRGTTDAAFSSDNKDRFQLVAPLTGNNDTGKGYGRFDRKGQRTFPGGTKIEWYAGPRFQGMHYAFSAQIENKYRYLRLTILDRPKPGFSPAAIETAILAIAQSVRKTDFHRVFYHPAGMQAVIPNDMWFSKATEKSYRFGCFPIYCGKDSDTRLFAYPSAAAFKSDDEALKDITTHVEKSEKLKIGATHRLALAGGVMMWTEQAGTPRPLLGVVRRAGKYYFVSGFDLGKAKFGIDGIRPHFLQFAAGLRPWDGR